MPDLTLIEPTDSILVSIGTGTAPALFAHTPMRKSLLAVIQRTIQNTSTRRAYLTTCFRFTVVPARSRTQSPSRTQVLS